MKAISKCLLALSVVTVFAAGLWGWSVYRTKTLSERLIQSSQKGQILEVKTTLAIGGDPDARDTNKWTPLMWASERGHREVARALVEHGADVNARATDGSTALMLAAIAGDKHLVKLLVENAADVNARSSDGLTPLAWAAAMDRGQIVALLRSHGARMTLPIAALVGDEKEVQRLISSGANVRAKDRHGWTALMDGVISGHTEVVKLLLEKGATVKSVKHWDGALLKNVKTDKPEIAELFKAYGGK